MSGWKNIWILDQVFPNHQLVISIFGLLDMRA